MGLASARELQQRWEELGLDFNEQPVVLTVFNKHIICKVKETFSAFGQQFKKKHQNNEGENLEIKSLQRLS